MGSRCPFAAVTMEHDENSFQLGGNLDSTVLYDWGDPKSVTM